MSKPIVRDLSQVDSPAASEASHPPIADRGPADLEMARVLRTTPLRMASDPSNGAIACWHHERLHDVTKPITKHESHCRLQHSQRRITHVRQ
jgi:AraC family transcriptional regulator